MNPSRPTMSQAEAMQFTKDFSQLGAWLIGKLTIAKTMEEALSMLENLANFDLPQAKTLYGMMFLMNGKPWYNITKALYWLKKGASASLILHEARNGWDYWTIDDGTPLKDTSYAESHLN